jgi:transposase
VLAAMAQRKLKAKKDLLARAVPGRFGEFHAVMCRQLLDHIDYLDAAVARLDEQVDQMMVPFAEARDRLDTIPGVARRNAENQVEHTTAA